MTKREQPGIPEEHLRACLQDQYSLYSIAIEFLPRGLDYNARVYRAMSEDGTSYLLKVKSGSLYEPGCFIPRYLRDQGIASVVAPLRTKKDTLWTKLGRWTVIAYPFIDGDTSFTGMTDEQWKETGAIFRRIHQATVPAEGFAGLRKETFDPTEYARRVRALETQHLYSDGGDVSEHALRASWAEHQSTIHAAVAALEKLAEVLKKQSGPYVICHADLHPANLIRDHADHVFVIDWDDVMLALKERDFIFVEESQAETFWKGYGQKEINWVALTYYRYERVVQDLIECAHDVFSRNDLGEETRADAAQLFHEVLVGRSSTINAAYAAEAHLPEELIVHTRDVP